MPSKLYKELSKSIWEMNKEELVEAAVSHMKWQPKLARKETKSSLQQYLKEHFQEVKKEEGSDQELIQNLSEMSKQEFKEYMES